MFPTATTTATIPLQSTTTVLLGDASRFETAAWSVLQVGDARPSDDRTGVMASLSGGGDPVLTLQRNPDRVTALYLTRTRLDPLRVVDTGRDRWLTIGQLPLPSGALFVLTAPPAQAARGSVQALLRTVDEDGLAILPSALDSSGAAGVFVGSGDEGLPFVEGYWSGPQLLALRVRLG